ncbi:glutathione S-transferase-like [Trichechus inunguis]
MAGKPKLYYFNGRGRMETIRWLLAAAGVEFEEELFETREEFEKLIKGGTLMYEQVPMVEIDGMNLVETRAILRYIAAKYDLYGRNLKEQAWIDMYVEGLKDLSDMIMFFPLSLPEEKEMNLDFILERATKRFFPVYEKALREHGQDFLVGNRLSWADIQLLEVILMVEECKPSVLSGFPLLQEFKARTSHIPTINKFLQPGSQRKPPLDEKSMETVKKIFKLDHGMFLKNMATVVAEY